jgi:hypothetical protein
MTAQVLIYLTVNQFIAKHPAFTEGGLRSLIFNEDSNGLAESGAIVRIGRKVLIVEAKFFGWVEAQNGGQRSINMERLKTTHTANVGGSKMHIKQRLNYTDLSLIEQREDAEEGRYGR